MTLVSQKVLSVRSDEVTVHGVGPGYGEGVVVTIGGRILIGIDCCTGLVQRDESRTSYLERIVSSLERPIILWLISHFHFDHFQSMTALLDQIGGAIHRLVVPADYLSADLVHDLALHARDEVGRDSAYYLARDEYSRLRRRLEDASLAGKVHSSHGMSTVMSLKVRRGGRQVKISADLYAPTVAAGAALTGHAVNEVVEGKSSRSDGNHTSYILHLNVGRFESLLLGDAPLPRSSLWTVAKRKDVSLFVLKVAHHGAIDGTSRELLEAIGNRARRQIAVICPFDKHRLPDSRVTRLLTQHGFVTRVSGRAKASAKLSRNVMANSAAQTLEQRLHVRAGSGVVAVVKGRM